MSRLGIPCLCVSALTGEGIPVLIDRIVELVRLYPRLEGIVSLAEALAVWELLRRRGGRPEPVEVRRMNDGSFNVEHENLERSVRRIDFDQEDAMMKFARLLKRLGVEEALEDAGAREGDRVLIGEAEFEFQPDRIIE